MRIEFRWVAALAAAAWTLAGCGGGGGSPPPPAPPPPPPPVTLFRDATATSGIQFQYGMGLGVVPAGPQADVDDSSFGGVASGDCENDGDVDLFVTYSDTRPNRLYRNQRIPVGSFAFVDAATAAGVDWTIAPNQNGRHSGPVFADLDGDGDLDLFLGALYGDPVKLYSNNGDCTFTDVTAGSGLEGLLAAYTFSAGFGDYDLDGDLDMAMSHWGTPDSAYSGMGGRDDFSELLWENVSPGPGTPGVIQFQNTSQPSTGVTQITYEPRSWGPAARCPLFVQSGFQFHDFVFSASFADLNNDGWPDLLLVGDFMTTQILLNNGNGTFSDASTAALCQAQQPMGSALGDYDDDGDLDWFTSGVRAEGFAGAIGNRFFRNGGVVAGDLVMTDVTDTLGVAAGGWGWGACLLDVDNDSDLDVFHTNGWTVALAGVDFPNDASRMFVFNGTTYSEQGAAYGLNDTLNGRGVVCADFDHDGDIDIFETTNRQPNSALMRENLTAASGRNFLKVSLVGLAPNTDAAGARVYLTIGARTQMREIMVGGDNYTSQNPTVQHFGIGSAASVDQLRIVWPRGPGGTVRTPDTVLTTLMPVNRTVSCNEATATPTSCP